MSVAPFLLPRPVYSLINTVAVPIMKGDLVVAYANVVLPINILLDSFLDDLMEGRSYGEEQAGVYDGLAGRLSSQFGVEGQVCLLRFICQLQKRPLGRLSLAGHLLSILFTPRVGNKGDADLLKEYLAAQYLGQKDTAYCDALYDSCPFSVFDYFDAMRNATTTSSSSSQDVLLLQEGRDLSIPLG